MIDFTSDFHLHTAYSPDADRKATFADYLVRAKEKGIQSVAFTDHLDIDPAHPLFLKQIDYDRYFSELDAVMKTSEIKVRRGIEIGYQRHVKDETNLFLKRYPFDFVILSIHYLEKKDFHTGEYHRNKTKKEAYQRYFEACLDAVQTIDRFDVFGHLDHITRYGTYGDYVYNDYRAIIDLILMALIERKKGIEINTSGYRHEGRLYPKKDVIRRFLELGGNQMTIGSDAHSILDLGRDFERAKDELKDIL
jgi:histidinol-phosphatase (PHP family)